MIVLYIFLALLVGGVISLFVLDEYETPYVFAMIVTLTSAIVLAIMLMFIPINRYDVRSDMVELAAFKETVADARKRNLDPLERAAILKDIARWNQNIASTKYANSHGWDLWIPDEVEGIEYIK